MTLSDIVSSLLIGPLKLIFELIFSAAYNLLGHPGPAIVVLSLAMNLLVLPLYRRADAIQMEARDTENRLKDVVTHIKKTFSGDERMMILQTYYRQNHYSSFSVLKSSLSLLLQIPFFMAAYQFLSNLDVLQGVSFGAITDLSKADGLLTLGSLSINLLPVIMTLVNVISSSIYLKDFPLKTKIQLYGMAAFFLVFLYNSPAALVLYWTLNNVFSLIKNLVHRFKGKGVKASSRLVDFLKEKWPLRKKEKPAAKSNRSVFVLGAVFLTVLVGLLIPGKYIGASPQEYIDIMYFYHPIWYVVHTLCLSAGTFLVWFSVFYWLAGEKGKARFSQILWILDCVLLVNFMFFGTDLGVVSPDLMYTEGFSFAWNEHLLNAGVMVLAVIILWKVYRKFSKKLTTVLLVGTIAMIGMSLMDIVQITKVANETKEQIAHSDETVPHFTLSQEGKNVVVIMLDRAISQFVPYIMEEKPELQQQFDGFTHYANSLAYGGYTNFAAPALYGGYEYTPVNLNLRDDEYLEDKHNEALKVLPAMFAEEGYEVTLIDPTYAGYSWIPDLDVFEEMDGITAYHADGKFKDEQSRQDTIERRMRNFFFFSLMKTMPVSLQPAIYDSGRYCAVSVNRSAAVSAFMDAYEVMKNMEAMTDITNNDTNTYMVMKSNVTHDPMILQEPAFEPTGKVDNSDFYSAQGRTITDGENSYLLSEKDQIAHYHANMAALIQLGEWFDYLRENDVYDNTRIIVVSDHGRDLAVFDTDYKDPLYDIEYYQSLLMVKDFDAKGFTTSEDFMTNADVPTLTLEDLVENPVNPYTGNAISSDYKTENSKQYVIMSEEWNISKNDGKQFLKSRWASVSGDVRDKANWSFDTRLGSFPMDFEK